MKKRWMIILLLGSSTCAFSMSATLTSEQIRAETVDYVRKGTQQEGIQAFTAYLSDTLDSEMSLNPRELIRLAGVADCVRFLRLTQTVSPDDGTLAWILASDERLHLLLETVVPTDDVQQCFSILQELATHDPAGRDDYFELMLAISVVWDSPKRPPMHRQMGKETLPYLPEVSRRYDYFKTLYSSGDAKMPYSQLGAGELIFVVETPVPLEELEWARRSEDGLRAEWGTKFSSIEYDHWRLDAAKYDWPYGCYTLQAIKEKGGICVDQAYYAVMTARAFGIPAIYFDAIGSSGGHAWFSFMQEPGEWVLDVGRYAAQGYTTGYAVNPQTNKKMTDHDVAYTCERSLHSESFAQADAYLSIAEAIPDDHKNVKRCAQEARSLAGRYLRPWELELNVLLSEGEFKKAQELFAEKQQVFRKYPDILVESAERIESAMKSAGLQDEALELHRTVARGVNDGRDDLSRFFGADKINQLVESGDTKNARRAMENLLNEQMQAGSKVFPLIRDYLKLTKESDQTHLAARFLEEYITKLRKNIVFSPGYERSLLALLVQAYKNDGDEKGALKTTRIIEEL